MKIFKSLDKAMDIILPVAIAVCMIFLNNFMNSKVGEFRMSRLDAMFVPEGAEEYEIEGLMEEVLRYKPDVGNEIEFFNEELQGTLRINVSDEVLEMHQTDLTKFESIANILTENNQGYDTMIVDNVEYHIFFMWFERGEVEQLMMVYAHHTMVNDIWVFSMVCYTVVILSFLILIRSKLRASQEKINEYNRLSHEIEDMSEIV